MNNISLESLTCSLEPLEFGGRDVTIACTPAAIDLAAIGLGAVGIGYFAAKAFYHKHGGYLEGEEELLDSGAAQHELLSSSELLTVRANELTRG